ncbi:MAG: mevalonate kinase [DPANN group archaeon]|nr:mevalonate kinase [DPANN group archaeon]
MECTILSPAKIILFGEHAVVYDKLGIASACGIYSKVKIKSVDDDFVEIISKDLGLTKKMSLDDLSKIVNMIDDLRAQENIDEIKSMAQEDLLLPSFVVVGKIMQKYGFKGLNIIISSHVPKNLGSSASVFNAISKGVLECLNVTDDTAFFANEGDKVVHGTPSGIDAYTIANGGWISYRKSIGIKTLNLNVEPYIVIVDSGDVARTADTVLFVKKRLEEDSVFVNGVMDKLDKISKEGLQALMENDLEGVGQKMTEFYNILRTLEISTPTLDEIVKIAINAGAFGAKPTGGWGGGTCIVLSKDKKHSEEITDVFKAKGFKAFVAKLGVNGTRVD